MMIISLIITALYVLLIGSFCWGFERVETNVLPREIPKTRFTIVIPFRNEALQLPALLSSILKLNYPKSLFEVILVDDHSEDTSLALIKQLLKSDEVSTAHIRVITTVRRTKSPKKDAITLAISQASNEWIVTTDADSVLPIFWLDSFDAYIQNQHPRMIVAPLTYHNPKGFLENFQLLDVLGLQGATIGGFGIQKPFLCNGANLAYTQHLFNSVNGFEGNSDVASGDDVFLLEKATTHFPEYVHYLKNPSTVVTTSALSSVSELIHQRVRWAAKATTYNTRIGKIVGSIVFAQNALLIVGLCLVLIGEFKLEVLVAIFLVKACIDGLLIYKAAAFFDQKKQLKYYAVAAFCYPLFSVYVVIIAVFKGYQWKDRAYRQ
ncbi:glycosyltransferase [Gelidibacter salicanalis]|uniref:Glycosyltransferase n=1 Tax=Gelidibacter salicanalis TaxID=291193 RepID=A0A5C7AKW8_9FLAO|nr:glycosyltransferase [Gelidibacter salicanalis]TXE09051.1 glycosyltransferase [Gelidibacter salicanalis]